MEATTETWGNCAWQHTCLCDIVQGSRLALVHPGAPQRKKVPPRDSCSLGVGSDDIHISPVRAKRAPSADCKIRRISSERRILRTLNSLGALGNGTRHSRVVCVLAWWGRPSPWCSWGCPCAWQGRPQTPPRRCGWGSAAASRAQWAPPRRSCPRPAAAPAPQCPPAGRPTQHAPAHAGAEDVDMPVDFPGVTPADMPAMVGPTQTSARGAWDSGEAVCTACSKDSQLQARHKASSGEQTVQCRLRRVWASGYAYDAVCCSWAIKAHMAAAARAEPVSTACPVFTSHSSAKRCTMCH